MLAQREVFHRGNGATPCLVTPHKVRRPAGEAAMRLVVRFLFFEFSLAWAMVLAGSIRVGVQIWPFFANTLMADVRRRTWRVYLGFLIGLPVAVGWPLLFWLIQTQRGYRGWLQAIAIPWWIVLGTTAFVFLVARVGEAEPRTEGRRTGCRCGTCVAREMDALPGGLTR